MLDLKDRSLFRTDAYIDGIWTGAESGKRFAVLNPATGEKLAEVADLSDVETRHAIEAAQGPCFSTNCIACEPGSAFTT